LKRVFRPTVSARAVLALLVTAVLGSVRVAQARPNTHAPAISTWDPRASSVVLGLGRSMSGDGALTFTSYNANFSSTNGVLSAQFGVHYMTFKEGDESPTARGVSAGGVALVSLPLSSRFENGVPGSAFAFYVGGVPTAMFSGQLNFISVPLVLGVGLPFSPSPYVTFRPWVELSPGLNFDTDIQPVVTNEVIQAAMDGTLTRDEVEALVEDGLNIQRDTTVGKRAGLSFALHLGERVDIDLNMMIGAGHPGAISLGGGLVFRWDAMVAKLDRERDADDEDCAAIAARYHRTCSARRPAPGGVAPARGGAPRRAPLPNGVRSREPYRAPAPGRPTTVAPAPPPTRAAPSPSRPAPSSAAPAPVGSPTPAARKPAPAAPATPPAPVTRPRVDELPPLQAAPPRSP
jgi:hypothetical protein